MLHSAQEQEQLKKWYRDYHPEQGIWKTAVQKPHHKMLIKKENEWKSIRNNEMTRKNWILIQRCKHHMLAIEVGGIEVHFWFRAN
jgi:hypothetical protein